MKFELNDIELSKVNTLLENKEVNIIVADMLQAFFSYVDAVKGVTTTDEYLSAMVNFWEIDPDNEENLDILNLRVAKELKQVNPKLVLDNPYFKNINFKPTKLGIYYLGYDSYYPCQGFSYDDIDVLDDNYIEVNKVGYFDKKISYPVLKHNKDVWMSITPNEILTMEKSINEANGDVLVIGLGLGYYPYMISLSNKVRSITIIEKDKDVIELFNKCILPRFNNKSKIRVINSDAYDYINKNTHKYDYAFIDIWHDPNDGLPLYLRFKAIEDKIHASKVSYWIEKSILALLRRCVLTVVEEGLNGAKEDDYKKAKNEYDRIINNIYFKTKSVTISNYASLVNLIKDENLLTCI